MNDILPEIFADVPIRCIRLHEAVQVPSPHPQVRVPSCWGSNDLLGTKEGHHERKCGPTRPSNSSGKVCISLNLQ